ncbi:MAG TPA: FadR/GntR family transcriptional regulator [Gemmatimonadaceae bacterium]|nr:FadR/GntR family transcriptional regulator [Gemmatimonadaceae bacterium]
MPASYAPLPPKERRYQEIVLQLQERILNGELAPGDRIPAERELAAQFCVSRTAVREAIKALAERGLVRVTIGRGTFVTELSTDRLAHSMALLLHNERDATASLSEARSMLEIPIARLAARHRTDEQLERLAGILDRFDRLIDSPRAAVDLDDEFHSELARAAGNPVLAAISEMVSALLREDPERPKAELDDLKGASHSRRQLLEAIHARDENAAERELVRVLAGRPSESGPGATFIPEHQPMLTGTDAFAVD